MAKRGILLAKKDVEAKAVVDKQDDLETSEERRSKNLRANAIPTEGYGLEGGDVCGAAMGGAGGSFYRTPICVRTP